MKSRCQRALWGQSWGTLGLCHNIPKPWIFKSALRAGPGSLRHTPADLTWLPCFHGSIILETKQPLSGYYYFKIVFAEIYIQSKEPTYSSWFEEPWELVHTYVTTTTVNRSLSSKGCLGTPVPPLSQFIYSPSPFIPGGHWPAVIGEETCFS